MAFFLNKRRYKSQRRESKIENTILKLAFYQDWFMKSYTIHGILNILEQLYHHFPEVIFAPFYCLVFFYMLPVQIIYQVLYYHRRAVETICTRS